MPQLGLQLSLIYLPALGANTQGGILPTSRLADSGLISFSGEDATIPPPTYVADFGIVELVGGDAKSRIDIKADRGPIGLSGADATVYSGISINADEGFISLNGDDAGFRTSIVSDSGFIEASGIDAVASIRAMADFGNINLVSEDSLVKISVIADCGEILVIGADSEEWEEDYVANYVENVAITSGSQTSSAFSIAGKIIWIDVPITAIAKTCTLQSLAADGTTWISTGIAWTTSTSLNTIVNSETLAKVAGKTGIGLNNFRLSYDSSLAATTTHIIRSRT